MRGSILLSAVLAPCLAAMAAQGPPGDEIRDIKNGKLMRARPAGGEATRSAETYRRAPASRPEAGTVPLEAELGLTVWRFRRSKDGDEVRPLVAVSRSDGSAARESWTPVRAEARAAIKAGQFVRFTVEAPRTGFVYVIARDRGPKGYIGDPMLIFPQRPGDDNAIGPARSVSAPLWSNT